MDLQKLAPGLRRDEAGYWVAPEQVAVAYPDAENDVWFKVEDESFWFSHRNRAIAAAVRRYSPADGPIFDVGAGNGFVAAELERAGFATIAIEPNRDGAANAAHRLEHVVCGALPSEAFRWHTAGAIGLFDVVEHVEHDREFLGSLRPYLKRGGRLYITAPAYQWLWSDNDRFSQHYRRYTVSRLAKVVASAGYRVEYGTYIFSWLPLPILFLRTLPSCVRRDGKTSHGAGAQHRIGGRPFRQLAERAMSFELASIARGRSIPFGASCLMVGHVPD